MLKASIDIGSNSLLLLIGDVEGGILQRELESEARITGLGKSLDFEKKFIQTAMDNSFKALEEYREIIARYGINPSDAIVTATEAMRVATNADEFCGWVQRELGFTILPINAEGEAYFTALGVVASTKDLTSPAVIMDIGGASTELMKVSTSPFTIEFSHSLPIGSVRATDFIAQGTFDDRLEEMFAAYPVKKYQTECVHCVAGTMTSLGAMAKNLVEFNEQAIDGIEMTVEDLTRLEKEVTSMSLEELLKKYPYLGKRVHTILGGCRVARTLARAIGAKNLNISKSGLRYGTILLGSIHERFKFIE